MTFRVTFRVVPSDVPSDVLPDVLSDVLSDVLFDIADNQLSACHSVSHTGRLLQLKWSDRVVVRIWL